MGENERDSTECASMEPVNPTPLDDYLFDMRGYLVFENAVEPELVEALNRLIDELPPLKPGEWWGNAERNPNGSETSFALDNCVEAGEPFERLIDHPRWINHMRHYCGEEKSYVQGLFIDEAFIAISRGPGSQAAHSGGYQGALRGAYHYANGVFRCGQCNILVALTDIQDGDGPTVIYPGSHKSNFQHPDLDRGRKGEIMEGAVQAPLRKGDALLFVDGLSHHAGPRRNPGERRVAIYRYGVSWGATRYGHEYSQALLDRLTPERRKILQPIPPRRPR
jgi:ectoine hydroxylase-related dioxygenase (phytanoyl-CoA dioxygenase family)